MKTRYTKALAIAVIVSFFLNACVSDERYDGDRDDAPETVETVHYNIIVSPDLSNRVVETLYPKPVSDTDIVRTVLDNIPRVLTAGKRNRFQNDRFRIDFINRSLLSKYQVNSDVLMMDFSRFKKQSERIEYLNGRAAAGTFKEDNERLKKEVSQIYSAARKNTHGADIWSYLNTSFHKQMLGPELDSSSYEGTDAVVKNKYRNVLILLTDGYIETGLNAPNGAATNKSHKLTKADVDRIRANYLKKGNGSSLKEFFNQNNYGIIPVDNTALSETEILVLELYDRSLSAGGSATAHPTDFEILQLFWNDWLEKSGVKNFAVHPTASSKQEVESFIFNFLGI
jgi:hypothetical protein